MEVLNDRWKTIAKQEKVGKLWACISEDFGRTDILERRCSVYTTSCMPAIRQAGQLPRAR
jgi:hypothetical protein